MKAFGHFKYLATRHTYKDNLSLASEPQTHIKTLQAYDKEPENSNMQVLTLTLMVAAGLTL